MCSAVESSVLCAGEQYAMCWRAVCHVVESSVLCAGEQYVCWRAVVSVQFGQGQCSVCLGSSVQCVAAQGAVCWGAVCSLLESRVQCAGERCAVWLTAVCSVVRGSVQCVGEQFAVLQRSVVWGSL